MIFPPFLLSMLFASPGSPPSVPSAVFRRRLKEGGSDKGLHFRKWDGIWFINVYWVFCCFCRCLSCIGTTHRWRGCPEGGGARQQAENEDCTI